MKPVYQFMNRFSLVFHALLACLINLAAVAVLSLPCALGFNVLSGFAPLGVGSVVLDLEDFIISNNILPMGSVVYVLFCCLRKKGWGW